MTTENALTSEQIERLLAEALLERERQAQTSLPKWYSYLISS
ncbi:MAG: hypothetical protein Q8S21_06755 [Candidatus Paracaedibacteraceae bacterium]|nr:hypothetical protein [Candidatus Paracaedibacteraceae bacterium]